MPNEYEIKVIDEIAKHIVEPNPVQKLLALAGKPIELLMEGAAKTKILQPVTDAVSASVDKGIRLAVFGANKLCSEEGILKEYVGKKIVLTDYAQVAPLELQPKDAVADEYDLSNALIVGAEGAVMGLATTICEGVPFAQVLIPTIVAADVSASMTLLSRHICQIATSYGYSSQDPRNIVHVLAAMVPQTETSDEGFLSAKMMVQKSAAEAAQFVGRFTSKELEELLAKGEAPALVKLIQFVGERLGIIIGEKELGMLVPIAGAVLNSSVNVAFQQMGHTYGKDYFRRLHLEDRYGAELINKLISERIAFFKKQELLGA